MDSTSTDTADQLRLLESWLPLAQAESERNGWGYDGQTLEQLILLAGPSLRRSPTMLAARASLWFCQRRLEQEAATKGEPNPNS